MMERKIIISNLKGIGHMEFVFPNNKGVYLLVGPNGTGKTTLMICMYRICNSLAFANGFRQPKSNNSYDSYKHSSIEYIVGDDSTIYQKKNIRWSPKHKNSVDVFQKYGFSETILLAANSKRIEPKSDEIDNGIIVPIDSTVINNLRTIFGTSKFDNLAKLVLRSSINLGGKADNNSLQRMASHQVREFDAGFYVINENNGDAYSEKRFSTGELAVVKLVNYIIKYAKENALILIDEIEMALHPLVQIRLLEFLTQISKKKNLTIIVATHSPSLIKSVSKEQIILLSHDDNNTNNIIVNTPCYAARALGFVDYEISAQYDYIFFVEDDMARYYLQSMIKRFQKIFPVHNDAKISIVPVGGYPETARLAVNTKLQFFPNTKVYALLDADAFNDDGSPKNRIKDLYNSYSYIIRSLLIIPELSFITVLSSNNLKLQTEFRNIMNCELNQIISSKKFTDVSQGNNPRKIAKDQFDVIMDECVHRTGNHLEIVKNSLIELIVKFEDENRIKQLLSQLFNGYQI